MNKFIKYKWHIYADNDIEEEIVNHLRDSDFDVLWVAENPKLKNQTDDFHYRKAKELNRYLLSNNKNDF